MKDELLTCVRLGAALLVACCVVYPSLVVGFAVSFAPASRRGSLVRNEQGKVIGSSLIAQGFSQPEYFWPRPSAVDYDASAAGGSNLSPANPRLAERAKEIIARLTTPSERLVPSDLVSASGSGLDPHITRKAAEIQIPRIAAARKVPVSRIETVVHDHAGGGNPIFGSPPLVNVLELNLALDRDAIEANR
jgi:K+-transporting ATPase ATPase C chain